MADTRTYHAICRDIVRRWVFPLVPDAHLLTDTSFVQARRHNYREDGVKVARSASIGEGVVLGRGAVIGEGAVVSRCVIGRNCSVGAGAVLRESHLWEGACRVDSQVSVVCVVVTVLRGVCRRYSGGGGEGDALHRGRANDHQGRSCGGEVGEELLRFVFPLHCAMCHVVWSRLMIIMCGAGAVCSLASASWGPESLCGSILAWEAVDIPMKRYYTSRAAATRSGGEEICRCSN